MKELQGNLWDFHEQGHFICITTNGTVKKNGECVMGRGIAAQAKSKFPDLPFLLGQKILHTGNLPYMWSNIGLFTLPVKHNWNEKADLALIMQSLALLRTEADSSLSLKGHIYLPRPGCGNGGLQWSVVKPFIEPILDDRFVVVEIGPQ